MDTRLRERLNLRGQRGRILQLVAAGCSTKEIAARLGITDRAVKWHIAALFELLDVPNRAALVREAMRQDLIRDFPRGMASPRRK